METVFERIQDCGPEAITKTNTTTVEEDLNEMTIEEQQPVTSEFERANCTSVYVPRINVTELRFDPYYSSVSSLLHFKVQNTKKFEQRIYQKYKGLSLIQHCNFFMAITF